MRRRKRRKQRINLNRIKWIFILGIIICCIINFFTFLYRNVYPLVMDYAQTQTVNIATLIIKEGIAESELISFNVDEVIKFEENDTGFVSSVIVNTPLLNRLLVSTTQKVEEKLLLVENGDYSQLGLKAIDGGALKEGVLLNVPWAAALNLSLFHNVGPKFPVTAKVIGNAVTDMKTDVKPYGINNAMLEISIQTTVKLEVNLPFKSQEVMVNVKSPLVIKMITGQIPQYYYIGNSTASPMNPFTNNIEGSNSPEVSPDLDVSEGMENVLLQ
ncbi:MAG: sporulation protein YunB [Turicibacter sp.]